MAIIRNVSYKQFRLEVENRKLVMWGAGKLGGFYARTICKGLDILCYVDKNASQIGQKVEIDEKEYEVYGRNAFINSVIKKTTDKIAVFVTPTAYVGNILDEINNISELDNIDCYLGVLLRNAYEDNEFDFTTGSPRIPKKIHYCWFGRKKIPDHLEKYMSSWSHYCPDYEIIRWDESNYDITKNRYMREAYEAEKWAFVPDYARLDIVFREGGIYFDTDVELLSSLDCLLNDDAFFGFSCNFQIGIGVGFGSVKGHPLIKDLRDYYDGLSFFQSNGNPNLMTCYEYQHPVFSRFGFSLEDSYQRIEDVVLYPSEVLSPDQGLLLNHYTKRSISVHHFEYSWASEEERKAWNTFKNNIRMGVYNVVS